MGPRFADFKYYLVFENLIDLLKTCAWPKENFENFGDVKLQMLVDHTREILLKRKCEINVISPFVPNVSFLYSLKTFQGVEKGCIENEWVNAEWQVLKSFILPFIKDIKTLSYLDIWKRAFTKKELK